MSMRNLYLYLYIALAFIAGLFLMSPQALAFKAQQNTTASDCRRKLAAPHKTGARLCGRLRLQLHRRGRRLDRARGLGIGSNTQLSGPDATWVGIGGVTSNDLIQAGTQAIIQKGQTSYEAWYELLPGYQTIIPLTINAGDSGDGLTYTNIVRPMEHYVSGPNSSGKKISDKCCV